MDTSVVIISCLLCFVMGFLLATRKELNDIEKEINYWCRESKIRDLEDALATKNKEFDKLTKLLRQ